MPRPFPVPKFRLRTTLVVPFVLQIAVAVGLVGYLSFRNGQKSVADLATQLSKQASDRVSQQLNTYLNIPRQANDINVQAMKLGMLSPQDKDQMRRFFWTQMRIFKNLSYMNFGDPQGKFVGVGREDDGSLYLEQIQPPDRNRYRRYALDDQGNPTKFLASEEYNFQEDAWYQSAVKAGKPVWSPIYQWPDRPEIISISSNYPLYNRSNQLVGVLGIDFILSQLNEYLRTLQISPSGKIFVMERNGLMIASSTKDQPYHLINHKIQRLNIVNHQNPIVRDAARQLRDRFGSFDNITQSHYLTLTADHQAVFVAVTPWKDQLGLKWVVMVVIPESDFMGRINANTRNAIWLCLAAFMVAVAIGFITSGWVTRPILKISHASSAVAAGDIDQRVAASHLIEIDRLASSFNRMAAGLKQSFDALRQSESRNQAILNAIPDLILRIHQDGRYLDIKPAQTIDLVLDRANQLDKTIYDVLPSDVAQQYQHYINQAIATGTIQEFEYQLQFGSKTTHYEARVVGSGEQEVILIVRDITDRKRDELKRQQAEAELLQSEERFRSLVANIPGAIYRCQNDAEWTMNYLSDAIATIVGYPASDFIDNQVRSYASIIHSDDRDLVEVVVHQALSTQSPFTLAYRVLHQDGSIRWVHEQGRGVFDANQQLLYLDGAIFDITERKQAERSLRHSEATNRALVQAIPDLLLRVSRDGTYLSNAIGANRLQQLSSGVAELAGTKVWESLPPEQAQKRMFAIQQALDTGFLQVYEQRLVVNGQVIDEEVRVAVMHDDEALIIVRDITTRKYTEDALRHSEATNRALVQAMPDLLLRVSRDGTYLSNAIGANRLQQLSSGVPELVGQTVWDSLPPEQAQKRMDAIQQALDTGSLQVYEQRLVVNGQVIDEEVRVAVMNDNEAVIIVRDITARKRAEEALRLANEELERRVEQRTAELRQEKERSELLLLNILPAEIAERLKQADASPADHFEEATILFADIVGFTDMAAKLEPMQLVDGLNQIFSAFDQLTEKYGLEKIKTIGDAYMVVGGLPVPRADHAAAIADIALEMQAHMHNLESVLGDSVQIRIGINTGSVIAGVIGIKKFIYDLWGDAVNIASRMESQGKPGHIQVTESTYAHLKDQYILQPRGTIQIKGRGDMMTYWLIGRR